MERFPIKVSRDNEDYVFEVVDYVHHRRDGCQFELYRHGELVAAFEPDPNDHLHVCKNTGQLDDELLHLVADEIETFDW